MDSIEELPWGPGSITLRKPLEVEVIDTGKRIAIEALTVGETGEGETFEEALLDLARNIESTFDELIVHGRRLPPAARDALKKIENYLPHDLIDS